MEGSSAYLYAALGVTLAAIVGYLLLLNGRLTGLRRERAALERNDGWRDDDEGDAVHRRPS